MKVLQINSVSGIRSTGRIATDIAQGLIDKGHECKIIYGREETTKTYENISLKYNNKLDSYIDVIKSRLLDNDGRNSKKNTKRIIAFIEKYKPDLIHLHNLHGYYINYEILFNYLNNKKIPIVWLFHDCWPFTGHCSYFSYENCDNWKNGCENCKYKQNYPKSILLNNSHKNWLLKKSLFTECKNLIIVTPSIWLSELVKQSFFNKNKVIVINNSIDTEVFKNVKSNFREKYGLCGKYVVLGVANPWSKRKGFEDFIKLSSMLSEEYKIVLVGLNNKQKKQLPENIIGIEKTNNSHELVEIYSEADCFLNLTYDDNYPTTNLEAQACGTPCITYNTGGSPESVCKENVVEQGDLESVKKLLTKNLKIKENDYSKEKMINKYIELYKEIVGE